MTSYTKTIPLERTSSRAINTYIQKIPNKRTANEYLSKLITFETFIKENYSFSIDELLISKTFTIDVYDLLSNCVIWLTERTDKNGYKLGASSIKNIIINARLLLESYDIEINPRKFRLNVKWPRITRQYKKALSKEDIIKMLEACTKFKLKTYLIFLAATGARAGEAASVRIKDIDFTNSKVEFRAEHTKMRVGRYMFLTDEVKEYLKQWIDIKYRERRLYLKDKHCNRKVKPNKREDDLVFSSFFTYDGDSYNNSNSRKEDVSEQDNIANIYTTLVIDFNRLVNQLNFGYENATRRRHVYTFHSMRRWCKSVISDVISSDYSEWAIGHLGSSYYIKSDKEKYTLFKRCEPFLTYLDQSGLEQKQSDMQSRLETLEHEKKEYQDKQRISMEKYEDMFKQMETLQKQIQKKLSN